MNAQVGYFPDEKIISYTATNKSLKEVLVDLSLKTDVNISFNERQIAQFQDITIIEHSKTFGYVLDKSLAGTDLIYKVIDDQIVIVRNYTEFSEDTDFITLSGYITDAKSSESLINANIYLPDYGQGTVSNEYGFYSLKIPKQKDIRIVASYTGFDSVVIDSSFVNDQGFDLELNRSHELAEVVITDQIVTVTPDGDSLLTIRNVDPVHMLEVLTSREFNSLISIGGESDIVKRVQFSSGVNSGVDGFGGLFVRGGSKDQNLVLLDGVPIYNMDHAFGIYSIFNSEVIKKAKLYKSGIPARYEGRLSSVLDIRTREGNRNGTSGNLTLGLFTAKASLEGPLRDGKGAYLVSFRRSIIDPWVDLLANFINEQNAANFADRTRTLFVFNDFNIKFNWDLNSKNRLYLSGYSGRDRFRRIAFTGLRGVDEQTSEDNIDWEWGNRLAILRLNSQLSNSLFLNTSLYYNRYRINSFDLNRFQRFDEEGDFDFEEYNLGYFDSSINDIGLKFDFDYVPNGSSYIKFGLSFVNHSFNPRLQFFSTFVSAIDLFPPNAIINKNIIENNPDFEQIDIKGNEITAYFEDEIEINSNLKINAGINANLILTEGTTYFNPQPRLSISTKGYPVNFFGSFGFYAQYVQALTNSGIGIPADLWLPSTDELSPQRSRISSIGLSTQTKKGFYFETELFYKRFNDIVAFNEGSIFNITQDTDWEAQIPKGNGEAYGIEFNFKQTVGKTNWFANYTFSRTTREFESINNGIAFPARFDIPHSIKIALNHNFSSRLVGTINWVYASGSRLTVPTEFIEIPLPNGNTITSLIFGEKNNQQLPDYHKLDIGISHNKNISVGEQKWTFGLTNVYNRQNPFITDIVRDLSNVQVFDIQTISIFPILPSISYSLTF